MIIAFCLVVVTLQKEVLQGVNQFFTENWSWSNDELI